MTISIYILQRSLPYISIISVPPIGTHITTAHTVCYLMSSVDIVNKVNYYGKQEQNLHIHTRGLCSRNCYVNKLNTIETLQTPCILCKISA